MKQLTHMDMPLSKAVMHGMDCELETPKACGVLHEGEDVLL